MSEIPAPLFSRHLAVAELDGDFRHERQLGYGGVSARGS